jgi:hypothetical protein
MVWWPFRHRPAPVQQAQDVGLRALSRLEQHARIAEQWPDYFSLYWRKDGSCRVGAGRPATAYVVDRHGNLKK